MNRYEHTIDIACPVREVFTFISRPENFPLWQSSLLEIRRPGDGPMRVGSEVTEVRSFMGRKMETTWTCTEHEPCERSSIEEDEGLVPFKGTFELEAKGEGTRSSVDGGDRRAARDQGAGAIVGWRSGASSPPTASA